jgi:PPOX class F420-dependent enzyme/OxyR family protein
MRTTFTNAEIAYLQSQRLARIATADADGQPHVVPVSFRYNAELGTIEVGGHGFIKRKKYRDVQQNPRVAIVIDDIVSFNPWNVRGIEIRGQAEILPSGGTQVSPYFDPDIFRITPTQISSWGIEDSTT